jgi:hypothetical protein
MIDQALGVAPAVNDCNQDGTIDIADVQAGGRGGDWIGLRGFVAGRTKFRKRLHAVIGLGCAGS